MKNNLSKRETNREMAKERFLTAAERLFLQNGFEKTSADEVAKEAGFTKRTLYQYFESKEDLFFAVILPGAKRLFAAYEEAMSQGDCTLEKIRLGNQAHLRFFLDDPAMFRLLNYMPANKKNNAESPHYQQLQALDAERMKHFAGLAAEAKADGSIQTAPDVETGVFFAFFAAYSLLYTVASVDLWERLPLDKEKFLSFSLDLLVSALKEK